MIIHDTAGTLSTSAAEYSFRDDRRLRPEIFETVEGSTEPVVRYVAALREVQEALRDEAEGGADVARGVLAWHRYEGDSRISVTAGAIDWFVSLDDSRGQHAAAAIERGHRTKNGTRVPGIGALAEAFPIGGKRGRKARRTRRLK